MLYVVNVHVYPQSVVWSEIRSLVGQIGNIELPCLDHVKYTINIYTFGENSQYI